MVPTILVVGATGNTGRSVVETLSDSINTSEALAGYRIIALTRSSNSSVAQKLVKLPNVTIEEYNWVDISPDWLRERNVVKAFIASHNEPSHFADESTFHLAALHAGVKYVVRISTTAANVHPDYPAYYPRQHWAVEALLSSPEFEKLQWTSLQPNIFTTMALGPALELIKQYRKDGKQDTLVLMADEDAPVGYVHPDDVGRFAAVLLSQKDHSVHNKARYVLNGPEDITGKQIVKLIEQHIGAQVKNVKFRDLSFIDSWAASVKENKSLILSIKHAPVTSWEGKCSVATTSREFKELAAPQITAAGWLKSALEA
ncbi:hypothetical protein V494_05706 [Pseudogymnoascus sp. VKM F-4513 (FW-928)]|nr:hypothetical protein V494_05706 [Pseudogymnoascus sp. VKM F-4513 (FW-928)]